MAKGANRDRRRELQWRRIVRQYGRSGLSVREFCRRGKLRETAFYFWRGELQRRQGEQEQRHRTDPPATPAFVAVRVEEHGGVPAGGRIEIVLSGGRVLRVSAPVDRTALADVLAVLEAQPC
jgi:transposase-like protein